MKRIESEQNASVKQWKKLYTRKEREKKNQFIIEGPHLVEEALTHSVPIAHLIIDEDFVIPHTWNAHELDPWIVPKKIMRLLSDTEHPQGVIAICRMAEDNLEITPHGKYLMLDGVQDPGNLGSIIRTADAFGLDGVILGQGTADLYNSKVLRSTQGSLFHLHVVKGDLASYMKECQSQNVPVIVSALEGALPLTETKEAGPFALVVGNEGSGVSEDVKAAADRLVYVPMHGAAESLNVTVATGILLYELQRKAK
ncbi:23S rRNA methyltransferase [Fictibacillus macauensis ZFHKF-1]|uniref:23S rRNA methyltransferase n=1 Tax=Fictibacillus macauensis ZFHKF-1 TaxID=1196324 RepID=I8AFK4_9BACL|nr:RNA methyltransferase [Fictibacillus macauensis]EIT84417.1 23S rRNA methyltransferase [Fictibacillus macauensis ZFHKF-1]